jgi:hypothetical protein
LSCGSAPAVLRFVYRAAFLLEEYRGFKPESGAAIAAATCTYISITLVIAIREELLEKLFPTFESNERSAWYDARGGRIVISDSDGT